MQTASQINTVSTWSSELSYSLLPDDVMRMQTLAFKRLRSSISWIQLSGMTALAFALITWSTLTIILATSKAELPDKTGWSIVVCLVVGVYCLMLANPIALKAIYQHMYTADGWMLGERRLIISEESIETLQSNAHSSVSMKSLKFIARDDRNHYLMIEPAVGFIVPNSAIESASNSTLLKQFLDSRVVS
jgi:hypothetical protein